MIYNAEFITEFIFVEHCITPCDVILVPGGSHPQLAEKAVELYNMGMAKYILFSGRENPSISEHITEAEWLKSLAVKLGVPDDCILCENKASHTFENANFSFLLLEKMNIKMDRIILACKAYHSRRVLLTYQHIFPKSTEFLVAFTVDKRGLNKDNWTTKNEYIEEVMGELEKIGKYFKDKIACIE